MARSCCGGGAVLTPPPPPPIYQSINQGGMTNMNGNDYQMVELVDGNQGDHPITGLSTRTSYGYRKHGDRFLMHVKDIANHTNPKINAMRVQVVEATSGDTLRSDELVEVTGVAEENTNPEPETEEDIPLTLEGVEEIEGVPAAASISILTDRQVAELEKHGVLTVQDLVRFGEENLVQIKGIGVTKAKQILDKATDLLNGVN